MTNLAYGIDFGTTNSAISVAYSDGTVQLVPLGADGSTSVPSILYLDATGNRSVGDLAVRTHLVNGPGRGRLMSSIKSWLTDEKFTRTTAPDGRSLAMEDLVAGIIGHLKREADAFTGSTSERLVLGRPVVFAGAHGSRFEAQTELAKKRLVAAANTVGFKEVELLDESTAALWGEEVDDGIVLSADFGGGTFDVSVVQASPTQWEVLSTHGVAVGGEYFDGLVFDACVAPVLGLDRDHEHLGKHLPVPNSIRQMRSLTGTLLMMSDHATAATLDRWSDRLPEVSAIVNGGHGYAFYRAVEGTKIGLSSAASARLNFARPGVRVDAAMDRTEFEDLIKPSLGAIADTIDHALTTAGVEPEDVGWVIRTGGSSQIPAFVGLLEDRFGTDLVHERDAFATVAQGLGFYAWGLWG